MLSHVENYLIIKQCNFSIAYYKPVGGLGIGSMCSVYVVAAFIIGLLEVADANFVSICLCFVCFKQLWLW